MNSDDPKLTAYALDELAPAERAAVEQLLHENPAACAEVEETKSFVAQLRRELKAEAGAPLTEEQKATVLAAAKPQPEPFSIDLVAPTKSGRWIHRWLPIAAGIVIVASIAALTINPLVQQKAARSANRMPPSLASAKDEKPSQMPEPELVRLDVVSPETSAAPSPLPPVAQVSGTIALATPPPMQFGDAPAHAQSSPAMLLYANEDERKGLETSSMSNITGNTRTKDKVIRHELPTAPGELFAKVEAEDGAANKNAPLRLPTVTPAPPSATPSAVTATGSGTLMTEKSALTSGTILGRSGGGILTLNGGALAVGDASKAVTANKPAPVANSDATSSVGPPVVTSAPYPYASNYPKPSASASLAMRGRQAGAKESDGLSMKSAAPGTAAPETGSTTPARPPVSGATARGIELYTSGNYDAAVNELTKAIAANPADATAHNYLGITASQRGWQEAAEKELETATRLDPANVDAHFNFAVVLAAQNPPKREAARHYYRLAIQLGAERDESLERLLGQSEPGNTEAYDAITDNAFLAARENPLSTFSIDVDTASYANVRRFLNQQTRPPKGAVRIEELLNYFTYDYPQPDGDTPFSATMEVATCPWAPEHRLVRIGLKGREIAKGKRPASNLVFLIDVSGSMQPENKLPLLKKCLRMLVDQLTPEDTVSIAVYAGASGTVLEPTHDRGEIRAALDRLESGGSTNGAAGIQLAYRLAEQSFIKGGVNRLILATDGDFNVGVTSQSELTDLITRKAKKGTFLTVLGFGMGNLKDSTLEKLADKGNGNYAYIDTLNEGRKVLVEQMNGTLVTIAKDVKIQVEFNSAQVGTYRLIGYENRLLAKEDFNDDKKDAGEIGAGHTVTALYEVVPAGKAAPGIPVVDPLKYQSTGVTAPQTLTATRPTPDSAELLTLKLRYKQRDGDTSKLLEFPLTDRGETWEKSSRDFRFAAAVAGFGMLLRESPHKGTATWDTVRELAMEGRGEDRGGYRGEFLTLIDKAIALSPSEEKLASDTEAVVTVSGEVRSVGTIRLIPSERLTVSQAILKSGGLGPFASARKIVVLRTEGEITKRLIVDVKEVLETGSVKQDLELRAGDRIVVPRAAVGF